METETRVNPVTCKSTLLTDIEIVKKLTEQNRAARIIITPIINIKEQLDVCAFDIRLGTEFILFEKNIYTNIDPLHKLSDWDKEKTFRRTKRVNPLKPFVLHPGEQILGSSLEYIRLPSNIFGLLSGRSSWSRIGLAVHSTAPNLQPNTGLVVTFELQNNGPVPIKLYTGMRIAQICFYELNREYNKKSCWKEPRYTNNCRTEPSKIWEDSEFDMINDKIESMENSIIMRKLKERIGPYIEDLNDIKKEELIKEFQRITQEMPEER